MVSSVLVAILLVAGIAFACSSILYLRYLQNRLNDTGFWAGVIACAGYVALSTGGVMRVFHLGRAPFGSFSDSLILVLWLVVTLYLVLESRWRFKVGGAFIFPPVAFGALYAAFRPANGADVSPILGSPWVSAHVALIFLGYSLFTLAALAGALYLIQERELRAKRLTFMHFALPSLSRLERLAQALVSWGFPLLTCGIAMGAAWSKQVWGAYLPGDPKMLWAVLTWAVYAATLIGRLVWGWRGRKIAILAIVGFATVVVNYFGISLIARGLHRF